MVGGRDGGGHPLRRTFRGRGHPHPSRAHACRQSKTQRGRRRPFGGSAQGRESRRQGESRRQRTGPAARRADHHQGERGLRRQAQPQWRSGANEDHRSFRRAGRAQPQEGRRDRHRPDQYARILVPRLHGQSAARADAESLESRYHLRRIVGRRRRGRGGRHRNDRAWQRHWRFVALAGTLQRDCYHQADAGPGPRLQRKFGDRAADDGSPDVRAGTAGAQHRRRKTRAGSHEPARSARSLVGAGAPDRAEAETTCPGCAGEVARGHGCRSLGACGAQAERRPSREGGLPGERSRGSRHQRGLADLVRHHRQ